MSNPTVVTTFANPDPGVTLLSPQELVTLLNTLVSSAIQGAYVPYVVSDATPAVNDQDKVWIRLDSAGRPLGSFTFYNGNWRRIYSGLPFQIRMFTGDPATYFDGTGLGLITGEWDGWAICNGQNNTTNLSNLFVVGGQMDNVGITGYAAGWQTNVTGSAQKQAGNSTFALQNNNLPNMTVQLQGNPADPNASHSEKHAIVTGQYFGTATNTITIGTFGADPTGSPAVPQVAVPTVPPFYSLAFAQWIGYA